MMLKVSISNKIPTAKMQQYFQKVTIAMPKMQKLQVIHGLQLSGKKPFLKIFLPLVFSCFFRFLISIEYSPSSRNDCNKL